MVKLEVPLLACRRDLRFDSGGLTVVGSVLVITGAGAGAGGSGGAGILGARHMILS
jgi:hypothetical protein